MSFLRTISVAALVACASAAQAADLPARQIQPAALPLPPVFVWTGFYAGLQAGGAWQSDRLTEFDVCVPSCPDSATGRATGIVGGGHVGFNYQIAAFVLGVEGDFEGADLRHRTFYPLSTPDTFSASVQWQSSVRGRIGYAVGPVLIYGTGGVAFADIRHTYFLSNNNTSQSFSDVQTGWTAGGGVEYLFAARWSARVEYRYTDFGRKTDVPAIVFPGFTERHEETQHAVRAGVSYHF